jgi:hypothetical protein
LSHPRKRQGLKAGGSSGNRGAMVDYILVLIGAATTAFGSIILMIWDYFKIYRESIERETNILNAAKEEMANNLAIAHSNLGYISQDIESRKEGKEIVIPLMPFHNEMWDLLKINFPKNLLKFEIVKMFGDTSFHINEINELIRSRENYRIHNSAMRNYQNKMHIYNSQLSNKITPIIFKLIDIEKEFEIKVTIRADEAGAYWK